MQRKISVNNTNKKLKNFLILSFLGVLLINSSLITGLVISKKYGEVTLGPGEKYNINIPFIGMSKNPMICGKVVQTDGKPVSDILVGVFLKSDSTLAGQNTTDSDGKYCIKLPEINSNRVFEVYVDYDNSSLELGSNDYMMEFESNKVYTKGIDDYAVLKGDITNKDALIENGRFEIAISYYNEEDGKWEELYNNKYYLNIEPQEIYEIPNSETDIKWLIPENANSGRYKIYIKASFNAKLKTQTVYFDVVG